jgi:diguanylate cyclase (GGDEF)-like protein
VSRLARSRTTSAVAACVGLAAVGAVSAWRPGFGSPTPVAAFAVIQATSWLLAFRLQPSDDNDIWQFDQALFMAAVVVLPPASVILGIAAGTAAGQLADRAPPRIALFNAGQMAVAATVGLGLGTLVADLPHATGLRLVAALVIAGAAMTAVNVATMATYRRAVDRERFWSTFTKFGRFGLGRIPFVLSMGVLAGVAAHDGSWLPLFALPPLLAMQFVLAEHLRAKRDRERAQGLFESSVQIHGSVRYDEVAAAIVDTAKRLLRCDEAAVADAPPLEHEWGARLLQGADGRWLVVGRPWTGEPLDGEAIRLLAALGAVAASALENARLVEAIEHQALHDALTGLPNHILFEDRVSQAITAARGRREQFTVMVLDLDSFKKVNDSLGHSKGNELLCVIADRIRGIVSDVDTVARLGSDHFTLLLPDVRSIEAAWATAERVLDAVRDPVPLGGHELFMTASIGIACYPDDGSKADHLLRNADSAMHRAKKLGKDTYQTYAQGMNELAHLRLARESELHIALQKGELRLHYQPQIDLRTGQIIGVEALVRWEHPVLGLLAPHEFVPLAEESGLIVALDKWVMYEACRQAAKWQTANLPSIRMAVNLSGRHFNSSDGLRDTVLRALDTTGLDASLLELEVTEGVAVSTEDGAAQALQEIRELGVNLAIDDFGTGYSMLSRLQHFPVDRLKIDRSFVSEIDSATADAPIVAAMIAMARSLKIEVVAEGVETLEQQIYLRNHGCDQAQGYLFGRPVDAEATERLLRTPSIGLNVTAVG